MYFCQVFRGSLSHSKRAHGPVTATGAASASLLHVPGGAEPPAPFLLPGPRGPGWDTPRGSHILPPLPTLPPPDFFILGTPVIPCQEFPFQAVLLENQSNTCRPEVGLQT